MLCRCKQLFSIIMHGPTCGKFGCVSFGGQLQLSIKKFVVVDDSSRSGTVASTSLAAYEFVKNVVW